MLMRMRWQGASHGNKSDIRTPTPQLPEDEVVGSNKAAVAVIKSNTFMPAAHVQKQLDHVSAPSPCFPPCSTWTCRSCPRPCCHPGSDSNARLCMRLMTTLSWFKALLPLPLIATLSLLKALLSMPALCS